MLRKSILDRFNTRFSYDLFMQLGEKAATRAARIWNRTGLPEPREGEYLYGENEVTVPLNRSGIALVFRSKSTNVFQRGIYQASLVPNDNVLQPLYRKILSDDASFEVRPGVKRPGANNDEVREIVKSLKKQGFVLKEPDAGFLGVLPTQKRHIVVANITRLNFKGKAKQGGETPVHNQVYGALAAQVTDAFASASTKRITDMFNVCRDIASLKDGDPGKILYSSWSSGAQLGPNTNIIVSTANAYGQRLSQPS
jgi:hypothetical protein